MYHVTAPLRVLEHSIRMNGPRKPLRSQDYTKYIREERRLKALGGNYIGAIDGLGGMKRTTVRNAAITRVAAFGSARAVWFPS